MLLLRTCSSKLEQELEQHRKEDLELRLSGGSPESQVALKVLPPCDFLCYSHFVSFFFRTRLVLQFEPQESSESISREEKLLGERLRLKLTVSSSLFIIIIKLLNNSVVPDEQLVEVECSSGWERKCDAAS